MEHTASSHEAMVSEYMQHFIDGFKYRDGMAGVAVFVAAIETTFKELDHETTGRIRDDKLGEAVLVRHAARMRTIGANIVLLRDGVVPALKIDSDNPKLRSVLLNCKALLWAEQQVMKMGIL